VKCKGRKQANSRFGHTLRNLGVRVAFRDLGVRECVDSTSRPFEFALMVETNEILRGRPTASISRGVTIPCAPMYCIIF